MEENWRSKIEGKWRKITCSGVLNGKRSHTEHGHVLPCEVRVVHLRSDAKDDVAAKHRLLWKRHVARRLQAAGAEQDVVARE